MASATSVLTSAATASSTPTQKRPVICVFCGSLPGTNSAHIAAARSLAQAFHKHGISLVYGGGTSGLMGELARTLVSLAGAEAVHGIIPAALIRYEQAGRNNTEAPSSSVNAKLLEANEAIYGRTTIVEDMHSRKMRMAKEVIAGGPGSGFVALSGGYGTLDELMEIVTWNQVGIHKRGVVVFNVDGYYNGLMEWIKSAVGAGFVAEENLGIMVEAKDAEEVVRALREYKVSRARLNLDWEQVERSG